MCLRNNFATAEFETLYAERCKKGVYDCIIVDECQFCTEQQVDELKRLTQYVPRLVLRTAYRFQM